MFKTFFKKIFGSEVGPAVTENKRLTMNRAMAYTEAQYLYQEKKFEEAVEKFDIALVDDTFKEGYGLRAYALQGLNFHADAIDDFTIAIFLEPDISNNYFGRSMSRCALSDYDGAIADIEKAIELSKLVNYVNEYANEQAKVMGWATATQVYESNFLTYQLRNSCNHEIKGLTVKKPIRRNKN